MKEFLCYRSVVIYTQAGKVLSMICLDGHYFDFGGGLVMLVHTMFS